MLRPAPAISRRRLLGGLAGLSAALLPAAALAASPGPATPPLLTVRPTLPPPLPIPPPAPADAVPPGGNPAPAAVPPKAAPPPPFQPFWVAPFRATPLSLDPTADAAAAALLPQFGPVKVTGPARDNFYPVEEP